MSEAIFVGTIIPLLFLALILKGENRLLILYFSWGIIAFAVSLKINNSLLANFHMEMEKLSISWAPIIEELTKALPLGYFLIRKEKKLPIVNYGVAAGIGFAILENYVYILEHMYGHESLVLFALTRSFTTCLIHAISTGIIAVGIALAIRVNEVIWPFLIGFYALAVTIHSLYNLYVFSNYNFIGMYMPILLYLIGFALLRRNRKKNEG